MGAARPKFFNTEPGFWDEVGLKCLMEYEHHLRDTVMNLYDSDILWQLIKISVDIYDSKVLDLLRIDMNIAD